MAEWTRNTKWLWLGRSGLQYRETIRCDLPPAEAMERLGDYFQAKGAALVRAETGCLAFERGRPWAVLFAFSERQIPQTISVTLTVEPAGLSVGIDYDLRKAWALAVAPSFLKKEFRELKTILEHKQSEA